MRKPDFCICENKGADQLCGNRTTDQRLVFATQKVQFLYSLNLKFHASCYLLWLHKPVFVGTGQKPRRPVSQNEAYLLSLFRRQSKLICHYFQQLRMTTTRQSLTKSKNNTFAPSEVPKHRIHRGNSKRLWLGLIILISFEKPEDQWSCKRSPDILA